MRENKQLSARVAMAVAVATLVGASAFAESRPSEGTRSRGDARSTVRRGTVSARGESGRGNESRNRATVDSRSSRSTTRTDRSERRSTERRVAPGTTRNRDTQTYERRSTGRTEARSEGRTYERRSDNRSGNRSNGTYRGNGRNDNRGNGTYNRGNGNRGNGNRGNGSYNRGNRTPYYHRGRVSNYTRYGGGYRVWIVGSPYPFYVPLAYWRADRFRVGLTIGLGGYYNDLGYYDYYDGYRDGVRDRSYNDNNLHSEADFRGVVESVDWRHDTFVVRNEATGSFVTVVLRDRREESVRAGDFIAVRGDWTTRGVFHAYDVDILD